MTRDQSIVFIVDDDVYVREAIEDLFRSVGHDVQAFGTTDAFLQAPRVDLPGCLILDVRLPNTSGLEFQREQAESGFHLPTVFITGHGDIPMSVAAMKAGAIEFLTKPFRDQDLLDAVHRGIALDRRRRTELAILAGMKERYASLTSREREIMDLVVAGQINKQIAGELGLSEMTVKVHRAQVMRKMNAKSLPELVRIADHLSSATTRA
ncbi:response regulator transcription factor [Microvirga subterranea]|uniref:LuxR family two component transcriptional regulator n=1 Tax=Microvirga subterranea TaxID=186651 RepID=A0A370HPZ0_9HYPH|nr:response regulator transcription factor [Microvirga subterranea]RDI60011.1 LuxR family two component transcriptional regulator [Microvirga subterranea]